jgi:lipopolysaccharide/colanic/teichoic acid biosynthesis glycosyltransferase
MIKRSFDIIIATIGLVILLPVLFICAMLVLLMDGAPIIFSQTRVGRYGKKFYIYKFRTMSTEKTSRISSVTIANDDRITPIGKILRQLKLDELPQLINVLTGDMSLVGPRPEVPHLFLQYPEELQDVMSGLRPGITDFSSLEYVDESRMLTKADNPEKMYLEEILPRKSGFIIKYAHTESFCTDLKIIIRTIFKLLVK